MNAHDQRSIDDQLRAAFSAGDAATTSVCHLAAHEIAAYRGGKLSAEDVERIEEHLIACEACRSVVLAMPKSPGLWLRAREQLEAWFDRARFGTVFTTATLGAAVCALLMFGIAPAPERPDYRLGPPLGFVQTTRGTPAETDAPKLAPNGALVLLFEPVDDDVVSAPEFIRVFERHSEGWRVLPATIKSVDGVVRITLDAQRTFGTRFGAKTLYVGLFDDGGDAEKWPQDQHPSWSEVPDWKMPSAVGWRLTFHFGT